MESIEARNVHHPKHREPLKKIKYDHIREAIVATLSASPERELPFPVLEQGVGDYLNKRNVPKKLFPKPGSIRWYTKAVQLDLEARGILERVPKSSPIVLRLTSLGAVEGGA